MLFACRYTMQNMEGDSTTREGLAWLSTGPHLSASSMQAMTTCLRLHPTMPLQTQMSYRHNCSTTCTASVSPRSDWQNACNILAENEHWNFKLMLWCFQSKSKCLHPKILTLVWAVLFFLYNTHFSVSRKLHMVLNTHATLERLCSYVHLAHKVQQTTCT